MPPNTWQCMCRFMPLPVFVYRILHQAVTAPAAAHFLRSLFDVASGRKHPLLVCSAMVHSPGTTCLTLPRCNSRSYRCPTWGGRCNARSSIADDMSSASVELRWAALSAINWGGARLSHVSYSLLYCGFSRLLKLRRARHRLYSARPLHEISKRASLQTTPSRRASCPVIQFIVT